MVKTQTRLEQVDTEIGKRIREARKLRSWSLNQLATQIGVSYQQLQKYEKGANRISASKLLEVSQSLSMPLQFFFSKSEAFPIQPTSDELKTAALIHSLRDSGTKKLLLNLIEKLLERKT